MANISPPFPSELRFASYLAYPSRRVTDSAANVSAARACHNLVLAIKQDAVSIEYHPRTLIQLWIQRLVARVPGSPLAAFLDGMATLVPMPRSSPRLPRSVWPALRLADAMVEAGLAADVVPCLARERGVPKAAYSAPGERPSALVHYESMAVGLMPGVPDRIILVDDVVTQGATFAGACARLRGAVPATAIVGAFAMARTVQVFERAEDLRVGTITCSNDGRRSTRTP